MTLGTSPDSPGYAAFVSYASADRRHARRIQRFLEHWIDRRDGRRLKVFLDETDIRGGTLDPALRIAVQAARTLVVCYSPAAAESRWVENEVKAFRAGPHPDRIAVVIVGSTLPPEIVGRKVVPGVEVRVHDCRRKKWWQWMRFDRRLELLRLLAFVADVDMRTLRNWYLRRTLAASATFLVLALAPLWVLLSLPVDRWERLDLETSGQDIPVIAAEVQDGRLQVAARFRGAGPQGFRNYIQVVDDALARSSTTTFEPAVFRRRLLPLNQLPFELRQRLPAIDPARYSDREPQGLVFAGEVSPARFVFVIPLAPTQEEIDEARDNSYDFGTPIPTVQGAVVGSVDNGTVVAAEVADLSPVWDALEGEAGPSPPSRGLSVAWSPEGDLWIGMLGRDWREAGGLWWRPPEKANLERVPGFASVQSVEVEVRSGRTHSVFVAERHVDLWRGIRVEPWPTRVVMRDASTSEWRAAAAPPYGTRSEVELVGTLDGGRIVRVDERVFRAGTVPAWSFLLDRRSDED